MRVTDSTAVSTGATLRATMLCRLTAICAAASAASTPVSGRAPCAPLPVMRMSKKAPPAIIGPARTAKRPTSRLGRLCMPKIASQGKRWNSPSSIIAWRRPGLLRPAGR
jgi:hypothetical protein